MKDGAYDRLSSFYTSECKEPDLVYDIYEKKLNTIFNRIIQIDPFITNTLKKSSKVAFRRFMQAYIPGTLKNWLRSIIRL
jgi:hypothetical protein